MKIVVKVINIESERTIHFSKFSQNFLRKKCNKGSITIVYHIKLSINTMKITGKIW